VTLTSVPFPLVPLPVALPFAPFPLLVSDVDGEDVVEDAVMLMSTMLIEMDSLNPPLLLELFPLVEEVFWPPPSP
jgi:hypothetical protein